jgi:formiminoglutamase
MFQTAYLKERSSQSVSNLFTTGNMDHNNTSIILKSSDDEGVQRNGGRRGSAYGPDVLINVLKKMNLHSLIDHQLIGCLELPKVGSFDEKRNQSIGLIEQTLHQFPKAQLIHLGGGHDHIYSLGKALKKDFIIINLDAHTDTRKDLLPHSGNPFRELAQESTYFKALYQIGIHSFANPKNNFDPLHKTQHFILQDHELENENKLTPWIKEWKKLALNHLVILSLDCDVIDQSLVPAVSAPNPYGMNLTQIKKILAHYKELTIINGQVGLYGIYEFNPLFDNVSNSSAKSICYLIHEILKKSE